MSDESLPIEEIRKNEISTTTNHLFQETTEVLNQQISGDSSKHTKVDLPEEIITDIISRMPVKPVFQFQCLSKNFSTITKDNNFIGAHLRQSARLRPSIIFTIGFNTYLIQSSKFDSKIIFEEVPLRKIFKLTNSATKNSVVGSCNGLVLAEVGSQINGFHCLILLNPTTHECDHIATQKLRWSSWGFGYCDESKVYKIVRIGSGNLVEVLTYGTDRFWRKLDFSKFDQMYCIGNGITVNGVVYWRRIYSKPSDNNLLIFSLEKEKFVLISCPFSVGRMAIMEFRGLLAACIESETNKEKYDIWVLKNMDRFDYSVGNTHDENNWEKICTDEIFPGKPLFFLNDRNLVVWNDCGFQMGCFSVISYDMICKETKEKFEVPPSYDFEAFNFVESIVSLSALDSR